MVDVVAWMKDDLHDRILVALALLAPLALLMLGQWRASLETVYAPADAQAFGPAFERKAGMWIRTRKHASPELHVIADRNCPCTAAALGSLQAAHARSARRDARLIVHYVDEEPQLQNTQWDTLLSEVPSTPTLLATDQGRLVYAGPVSAGSSCTAVVSRIFGLIALEARKQRPVVNWIERGCFCRMPAHLQSPAMKDAAHATLNTGDTHSMQRHEPPTADDLIPHASS